MNEEAELSDDDALKEKVVRKTLETD